MSSPNRRFRRAVSLLEAIRFEEALAWMVSLVSKGRRLLWRIILVQTPCTHHFAYNLSCCRSRAIEAEISNKRPHLISITSDALPINL